ncbi:unnamed protein product [marine sediment metagenome]|uniref:Uncharacterized protein n=1 Tax=marine sediment metagenome TaxID=412755 RepID=X1VQH0_9ZZZZ
MHWLGDRAREPRKCEYCGSEKNVEWHHPVDQLWCVGIDLCQKHHTLVQGRKKLYTTELDKALEVEREKVKKLVRRRVARAINLLTYYLAEEKFKG